MVIYNRRFLISSISTKIFWVNFIVRYESNEFQYSNEGDDAES